MIKQAIIPLAGLGTRLLPLTSVIPKELLPINGRPGIEYIIEECINAGIKELIFVISKEKNIIKKYYHNDKFYKSIIKRKRNTKLILEYKKIKKYKKMIKFVYQNKPLGTGDAILKCKKLIKSSHFLVLLPDDLIIKSNCSKEMINIYKKNNFNLIASKKVIKKNVSRWGIFKAKKINKRQFSIKDVVEKPSIKNAPSNFAIIGRYILPKKIFKILPKIKKGKGGEFHITDAIRSLINNNEKFVGYIFKGKYLDCGSMKGYINSSKEIQ
tara:strand:- start:1162 stop:1968 length:807 start_codon:yes stop_codon:yes gene_type:complete